MLPISVKLPTGKCLIIKQEKEDEIELKRQIEDICGVPIEIQDLINVPNNSNCSSKSEGVNKPTSYFQMKVDFCWEKVVTSALKGDLFAPSRVSLPWRGVTKRQEVFIASFIAAANGHTKLLRDILSRNFYCFVDNFKTKITKRTILHAAVISRNIEGISIMTKYSTIFSKMLTSKDYRNCTPIDIVEKYDAPEIKKIFFPDPEIESLKTSSFRNKRIEEIGNTENATYGANEFRIKEGLRDNMHQVLFQDLPNEQEDAKQDNINTRKKSLRKINVVLSSFDLDDSESGSDSGGERKKTDISCHYIKSDTSPLLQRYAY